MYTYRVVSDVSKVPDMSDLEASYVEKPSRRGGVFRITFSTAYPLNQAVYEPAVGVRCRVVRTSDDGESQECGGAVQSVTPRVRVSLDGEGWH